MVDTWVYLLVHDRPEWLRRCLKALLSPLLPAGAPYRLAVYCDAPDEPTRRLAETVKAQAEVFLMGGTRIGAGRALNRLLATREEGEHVLRLDSDTILKTPSWLATLEEGFGTYGIVAPAYRLADSWAGERYADHQCPPSGANLYRGDLLDALGRFRSFGLYGCEDLDYALRASLAGYRVGIDHTVRVKTAPSNAGERRDELELAMRRFKAQEARYAQGDSLVV